MKQVQRPWWALALQMPALDTVLREDHHADEKRFLIEGKPVLKSLTWVIYGPILAVIAVIASGYYVWAFDIRAQPTPAKLIAVCGMVLLPLMFWFTGGGLVNKLVVRALNQAAESGCQAVTLTLKLTEQILQINQAQTFSFEQISGFKLISDSGLYYDPERAEGMQMNLVLETDQGAVVLLPKELGSVSQKLQLLGQLQALIGSVT